MWPPRVHSVNLTLHTNFGFTQTGGMLASTFALKGEVLRTMGLMARIKLSSVRSSKPVPVCPTYTNSWLLYTPSKSAPKCFRLLRGAV